MKWDRSIFETESVSDIEAITHCSKSQSCCPQLSSDSRRHQGALNLLVCEQLICTWFYTQSKLTPAGSQLATRNKPMETTEMNHFTQYMKPSHTFAF